MREYLSLLAHVMANGEERDDRTGVGTIAVFGQMIDFDLRLGFPAVTTKKLYFKSVAAELAGFLEGTESAARMRELGTKIWDANANAPKWLASPHCRGADDMGRVYGSLWRSFHGVDQLKRLVDTIIERPTDRRLVVTAWDPSELVQCLPPCHIFWQVYVSNHGDLDLLFHMRSVDIFLGLPFDIASYALLQHLLAKQCDLTPRNLIVTMGDTHIYQNHFDQVRLVMSRQPYALPQLSLWDEADLFNFRPEHASLVGYQHHPEVKAPMAV